MIDTKDIDYCALVEQEELARARNLDCVTPFQIAETNRESSPLARFEYQIEEKKKAQVEMLEFALMLCNSDMTIPMMRVKLHNKKVEITGEGQLA